MVVSKPAQAPLLQIGMQYGTDSKEYDEIIRCHHMLNRIFEKHHSGQFFDFYSGLAILGRVAAGEIDFGGGDGPERLRTDRDRTMILDLVIPENAWKGRTAEEVRGHFKSGIRQCFEIFILKADEKKRLKDVEGLRNLIDNALNSLG